MVSYHDNDGLQKITAEEFIGYLRWRIGVDLVPFPAFEELIIRFGGDPITAIDGELSSANSIIDRAAPERLTGMGEARTSPSTGGEGAL